MHFLINSHLIYHANYVAHKLGIIKQRQMYLTNFTDRTVPLVIIDKIELVWYLIFKEMVSASLDYFFL